MRTLEEVEDVALRLREAVGLGDEDWVDLLSVLQKLPTRFPDFRWLVALDEELPGAEAKADCAEKTIVIKQSVYDGIRLGRPRSRMTLAHEIGHIVLGHAGTRLRSLGRDRVAAWNRDVGSEEQEARWFAAVFLSPTRLASTCGDPQALAERFGLSGSAAERRWDELEARRRREGGDLRPLPESGVSFLLNQMKSGYKVTAISDDPRVIDFECEKQKRRDKKHR